MVFSKGLGFGWPLRETAYGWTKPAVGRCRPSSFISCNIDIVISAMGALPLEVAGWTGRLASSSWNNHTVVHGGNKPATRRPVITRQVRSGQCSFWRGDPMRLLATYSLLWWPPVKPYLVRDFLPKDEPRFCWLLCCSCVFDFVVPVVRGRISLVVRACILDNNHSCCRAVLDDPYDTMRPLNDDDKESVERTFTMTFSCY
jgi:hypothetical protein